MPSEEHLPVSQGENLFCILMDESALAVAEWESAAGL